MSRNDAVIVDGCALKETDAAVLIEQFGEETWVPLSLVTELAVGEFQMPRWLAEDRELEWR